MISIHLISVWPLSIAIIKTTIDTELYSYRIYTVHKFKLIKSNTNISSKLVYIKERIWQDWCNWFMREKYKLWLKRKNVQY